MKVRRQQGGKGTLCFGVHEPDLELNPGFATYQQLDPGQVNLLSSYCSMFYFYCNMETNNIRSHPQTVLRMGALKRKRDR